MSALWFVGGLLTGIALVSLIQPANATSCCQRVAAGARDKIAGEFGPFSGIVSGFLDTTGLTEQLPGLLDTLGVPTGAS